MLELERALRARLDRRIGVKAAWLDAEVPPLWPEEAAYAEPAVDRRKRELAVGRHLAEWTGVEHADQLDTGREPDAHAQRTRHRSASRSELAIDEPLRLSGTAEQTAIALARQRNAIELATDEAFTNTDRRDRYTRHGACMSEPFDLRHQTGEWLRRREQHDAARKRYQPRTPSRHVTGPGTRRTRHGSCRQSGCRPSAGHAFIARRRCRRAGS